jgi:glycosyltransferase involved in cell wall biosynthesis
MQRTLTTIYDKLQNLNMRIGIEAQRIFRKKKHGMDMVAIELIRSLQRLDTQNEYFIFIRPDEDREVLTESPNFHIVEIPGGPYPWWEQVLLPRAVKKYKCEILHCTGNTAPMFSSVPLILTLHDIIFMETSLWGIMFGEGSSYQRFGNIYRRWGVPRVINKSRWIVTVSNFENRRIREHFGAMVEDRVLTVYNGVGDHFCELLHPSVLNAVREKYRLPDRYFFFLGNTHPKKNTRGVLQAYSGYVAKEGTGVKLMMVDYDRAALKQLLVDIGDPELFGQIVIRDYVNNADLPAIYAQSELFLYPSLRESFGIPIIEAMAAGTPVISSTTSSMPEISGRAAILVDPFKPAEITEAMIRIRKEPGLRGKMIGAGRRQAQQFNWSSAAKKMSDLYRTVVDGNYGI